MTPASSELAPWPQRSRSLEPLAGLALWSSEPVTVVLEKSQKGLGFSILDYHVSGENVRRREEENGYLKSKTLQDLHNSESGFYS